MKAWWAKWGVVLRCWCLVLGLSLLSSFSAKAGSVLLVYICAFLAGGVSVMALHFTDEARGMRP